MHRLFNPNEHRTIQKYKESCEKSSFWNLFKNWISFVESSSLAKALKVNNIWEFNPAEFYKHLLFSLASYQIRVGHLLYIFKLPHFSSSQKVINAVQIMLELMRTESQESNVWEKMSLWKMIVMKLDEIEDMVSLSLLQKTFREIESNATNGEKLDFSSHKIILKNLEKTYCLSPHSVNCLIEEYPQLMHEVLTENVPAYAFITNEIRTDWLLKEELKRFEAITADAETERLNEEFSRLFPAHPSSPLLMDY